MAGAVRQDDGLAVPGSGRLFRLLVTGGRSYADRDRVYAVLDQVAAKHPCLVLVHGAASGADTLAAQWALARRHGSDGFAVNHELDGAWPGAGPRRNARMIAGGRPHACVAFPGGAGTADCVRRARAAGLPVMEVAP